MNNIITLTNLVNNYMNFTETQMLHRLVRNKVNGIKINMKDFKITKSFDNRDKIELDYCGDKFKIKPYMQYILKDEKKGIILNIESVPVFEELFEIYITIKFDKTRTHRKCLTNMLWMSNDGKPMDRAETLFNFLDGKTSTYIIENF